MRKSKARRWTAWAFTWTVVGAGGCLAPLETDGDGSSDVPPPTECDQPADCAHLVAAGDPCLIPHCASGTCEVVLLGSSQCQCRDDVDCASSGECATIACVDYQCVEEPLPAGPAEIQSTGDCAVNVCNGVTPEPVEQPDLDDAPRSEDGCTSSSCGTHGPETTDLANGTTCAAGVCFDGTCLPCAPDDPAACGGEGPNEPTNDSAASATSYARYASECGFLDGSDLDWYTFFAEDEDFRTDIMDFDVWSTADTIELCAYVSCQGGGDPDGGCSEKVAGPLGSQGCCWSGRGQISPSWDLDCSGTSEDSGTVYFSVRAPGGSSCETYAFSADY